MWLFIIIVFHSIISIVYLNSLRSWLILTVPKASIFFSLWLKCVFQRDAKSINIQRFLRLCFLSAYSLAAEIIVRIDGDRDFSSDSGFCLLCFSPVWRLGSWVRLCQSPYSAFWISVPILPDFEGCVVSAKPGWMYKTHKVAIPVDIQFLGNEWLWFVSQAKMNFYTQSCDSSRHTHCWKWDKVDRWEWQLREKSYSESVEEINSGKRNEKQHSKGKKSKDSTQTEWLPRDSMDLHTVISIAWALRQTNCISVFGCTSTSFHLPCSKS